MKEHVWHEDSLEYRLVEYPAGPHRSNEEVLRREIFRLVDRVKELEATIAAVEKKLADDPLPHCDQGLPLPDRVGWHLLYAQAGNEYGVTFLEAKIKELEANAERDRDAMSFWRAKAVTNDHALAEWEEWFEGQAKQRIWDCFINLDTLSAIVFKEEVLDLREDLREWEEWFAQVLWFYPDHVDEDAVIGEVDDAL